MKYELVSISEAARRLGVSRPTIYARLATRELRGRRLAGRTFVVWIPQEAASEVRA